MIETRAPERYFYHSFPRRPQSEGHGHGLAVLEMIRDFGLLMTPEIAAWQYPHADGTPPRIQSMVQRRISFTELAPHQLPAHALDFGPFALEFDIETLKSLGAIPVAYVPQASAESSAGSLGGTLVNHIIDAMRLTDRIAQLQAILDQAPVGATRQNITIPVDAGPALFDLDIKEARETLRSLAEYDDLIAFNPATGFGVIGTTKARTRVLTDAELKEFWGAIVTPPMLPPDKNGDVKPVGLTRAMGIALQLAILLLVRANEVGGMRVDELNFETKTWLIPGNRMKAGLPHLVPLPEKAIELIQEALALRPSQKLEHVFPSPRWHVENKGFRPDSIYHAMIELFTAKKIKHATPHDLRRTGSTALTSERIGVAPFIRSKVLGHRSDAGGGSAVSMKHYDTNEYIADKREALTLWQDLVLEIVGEKPISRRLRAAAVDFKATGTSPRRRLGTNGRRSAAA